MPIRARALSIFDASPHPGHSLGKAAALRPHPGGRGSVGESTTPQAQPTEW